MTSLPRLPAVPILLYHCVGDDSTSELARYTVTPAQFDEHLAILREEGFTTMTISQLVDRQQHLSVDDRVAVVTFDDGFASVAEIAAPIVAAHDMAATLYATTGLLEATSDWLPSSRLPGMSWSALAELDQHGWEIGAHTASHPQLDVLSIENARHEIRRSKQNIESNLGHEVASFAYPHGYHGPTVRQLAIDEGFLSACAVKNRLSCASDDPFALARVTITNDVDGSKLASMLRGEKVPVVAPRETMATKVWRQARRCRSLAKPSGRNAVAGQ